jgi:hypothetical protein
MERQAGSVAGVEEWGRLLTQLVIGAPAPVASGIRDAAQQVYKFKSKLGHSIPSLLAVDDQTTPALVTKIRTVASNSGSGIVTGIKVRCSHDL